jgi:Carboxypeptidase regulatory-like domain
MRESWPGLILLPVVLLSSLVNCNTSTKSGHSIAGNVSGAVAAGVGITLGGASSQSTTTDASGTYRFVGLSNGRYTLTPTLSGIAFSPSSISVTLSDADVTSQDFSATALSLSPLTWDQGDWDQLAWQ